MTAPRRLRPRQTASLSVAPVTVTDLSSPAVLGLEGRTFRELLVKKKIPHTRLGQRIIARVDDVLAVLDRLARESAEVEEPSEKPESDRQPETVDAVLAMLGKERVA